MSAASAEAELGVLVDGDGALPASTRSRWAQIGSARTCEGGADSHRPAVDLVDATESRQCSLVPGDGLLRELPDLPGGLSEGLPRSDQRDRERRRDRGRALPHSRGSGGVSGGVGGASGGVGGGSEVGTSGAGGGVGFHPGGGGQYGG